MIQKQRAKSTSSVLLLACLVILTSSLLSPPAATGSPAQAPTKRALNARAALHTMLSRPFFAGCAPSSRFKEHRVHFGVNAIVAGRCLTSRIEGIKLLSSYPGHHPSAGRAIDVMVNLKGNCRAGRKTGNQVARYLMRNAHQHHVYYLIWQNRYWNASSGPRKLRNWKYMGRGGCTEGHYDHVHVSLN